MREKLAGRNGLRGVFLGTFVRYGKKTGWQGRTMETVLLQDIYDQNGILVCDHLWFNKTQGFAALGLQPGEQVQFEARVQPYTKGYRGHREHVWAPLETDYKLSRPTHCRRITPPDTVEPPGTSDDAQMALFRTLLGVLWLLCALCLPPLAHAQVPPVSLAWDAPVPIALPLTGYRLWRRGSTGPWARLATVEATALRYTDLTPAVGVNCYYVGAVYSSVESAGSNRVCVTRRAPSPQRLREVRR